MKLTIKILISSILLILLLWVFSKQIFRPSSVDNCTGIYLGQNAKGNTFIDSHINGCKNLIIDNGIENSFNHTFLNTEKNIFDFGWYNFIILMIAFIGIPWWPKWLNYIKKYISTIRSSELS
jgi:hypothetical protein